APGRGERAAGDLLAGALGDAEPGVGLGIFLGGAGARRGRGLAVVLAGLGDAEALLGRRRLGLPLRGEQQGGAERRGDAERGLHGGLLHGDLPFGWPHSAGAARCPEISPAYGIDAPSLSPVRASRYHQFMKFDAAVDCLAALGNPTRLQIYRLLARSADGM